MSDSDVRPDAFPAPSHQVTGTVNSVPTEASVVNFSDKILLTLSQGGRLSQWVQVPLSAPSPALVDMAMPGGRGGGGGGGGALLPATHLTAKTLLGGGGEARETFGHLCAAQAASLLALKDPDDRRTLVLGLGLERGLETSREGFFDILELLQNVI